MASVYTLNRVTDKNSGKLTKPCMNRLIYCMIKYISIKIHEGPQLKKKEEKIKNKLTCEHWLETF